MRTSTTMFGRASVAYPTAVCAIVFFLASADRFFTIRTEAVNVRFATVALLVTFAVYALTRGRRSGPDIRVLAIAWLPFVALYALAAATSHAPAPAMLKLGWFAFDFIVAFAVTALFQVRDVVRGYFLSYLVIACIIAIDFVTGSTRGVHHMIGYGQANDMVPGAILFRPHAFYFEPSFAANSVAFAWALALTSMRNVAPRLAAALAAVGVIAIVVMTSRIGWIYAAVAAVAVFVFRYRERSLQISSVARIVAPVLLIAAVLAGIMAFSDKRDAVAGLFGKLGFTQAFERVCPLIAEQFAVDIDCLTGDARRRFLGEGQQFDADKTTEGLRLAGMQTAVATIAQHPWLGIGVSQGHDRFIAAPAVAHLWLEVAVEGGILSLLAFAFGVLFTSWRWGMLEARNRDVMIVFALWLMVMWQFSQTFPRLDLWIAYWVVLVWTRRGAHRAASTAVPTRLARWE